MTVLHMVNCCITAFGPAGIFMGTWSENGNSARLALMAAAFYLANQAAKSLLLVILPFPEASMYFNPTRELIVCAANIVDVIGVTLLLNDKRATGFDIRKRLLFCGLGWGLAEAAVSNFAAFLFGARAAEFQWEYSVRAVLTNYQLACQVVFTALVFIFNRKGQDDRRMIPMLLCFLLHLILIPFLTSYRKRLHPDLSLAYFIAQLFSLGVSGFLVRTMYHHQVSIKTRDPVHSHT